MIYVFFTLAAFLLFVAIYHWRDGARGMGVWFLFCAALNAGCGIGMLMKDDPHAYKLHDRSEFQDEPDPGMPDRR